jgi:hypothetical protein
MGDSHLPFHEAVKKLEGLIGINLKPDQQRALKDLYMGSDLCLIKEVTKGMLTKYELISQADISTMQRHFIASSSTRIKSTDTGL